MKRLEKNIINSYGKKGEKWLFDLSDLVARIQVKHGLSDLEPVKSLSYNYVLSGFQGEQPIIVKLSLDVEGLKREAMALKAFAGFGVVQVLADSDGLLLLERVMPGISLKTYFPEQDAAAIDIVCRCLMRLHKAPLPYAHRLSHIRNWLALLDKQWDIPDPYLDKARRLRDGLLQTAKTPVLLHGDLHQDNILKHGDDWLVIDPKGVVGEPAYEAAAFIRNPIPELLTEDNAVNLIHKRIAQFSKTLELPQQRILDWCFVQAVLTWVWASEDGGDTAYFRKLTELFDQLK